MPVHYDVSNKKGSVEFSEWAVAENQPKHIELHIYPVIMGGRTHKTISNISFYRKHMEIKVDSDNYGLYDKETVEKFEKL